MNLRLSPPPSADTDGQAVVYGSGDIGFLLVHGLGGTPRELHYIAAGLARAGYTVSCCQLAGHCNGIDALRRSHWRDWYRSVERAHDELRRRCTHIFAGGLSMGAILALRLAQRRASEIRGLVLYAPTFRLNGWAMPWYAPALRLVHPRGLCFNWDVPEREPYGIRDERIRSIVLRGLQSSESGTFATPLRSFGNFNRLVARVRQHLGDITLPTLILHPRHDDISDLDNAVYIQRHLGGPAHLVILDNSYHLVVLDCQRDIVLERTTKFARETLRPRLHTDIGQ